MRPAIALAAGSLVALLGVSVFSAGAAANTVPPTNAGMDDEQLQLSQLAPPECSALMLTRLQVGPGGSGGGNALVLASGSGQTLSGGGGDDCLVGGPGVSTTLNGQGGNDILIAGGGLLNFLNGGGGYDICYGAGWLSIPSSCEEYYP